MIMNPTVKYSAFIASLLLIMPYVVYADQGSISQHVSKRMQMQMVSVTCWNTLATGYLNDVVSEINNATITSTITHTDIPKLGSDFNSLQTDANSNNAPQFKTDTKTFRADTKTANFDIRSAIKAVHNKSVFSTLKLEMVQLKSTYKSCLFGVKQQHATFKVHI